MKDSSCSILSGTGNFILYSKIGFVLNELGAALVTGKR